MRTTLRSISTLLMFGTAIVACSSGPTQDDSARAAATTFGALPHGLGRTFANERACPPAGPREAQCHLHMVTDGAGNILSDTNLAGVGGLGADALTAAYHVPAGVTATATIAIVDAYDDPTAGSDLQVYRSNFGLPGLCNTGCFRRVAQDGSTNYPAAAASNGNWLLEEALDLEMASVGCPTCNILLVEANSSSDSDLNAAVATAVRLGASVVSMSWGGGTDDFESTLQYPGVALFASSGDNGYGVQYPAGSPLVTAVGGTTLTQNTATARGWSEVAWSGAGSGCSSATKPSWQHDSLCGGRTVADVSAVASNLSPVAIYVNGAWGAAYGTSVASPLVAGIYAGSGHTNATGQLSYANLSDFNDVTSGSNGACGGTYLCTSVAGYDGPTGNGTPDAEALAGYPTITSLSVNVGPSTGGTVITVSGARFSTSSGSTQFTFGGYPAAAVNCTSSTTCLVTTPAFNPTTINETVDLQATVAGKPSDLVAADKFSFIGSGPICSESYWTCQGATTDAVFVCNQAPTGATFQIQREVGTTFVPVATTIGGCGPLGCGSGPTSVSELGFVPPASQTSTTYKVCFVNSYTSQETCSLPITLTGTVASECTACHPTTCAYVGVCGTAADGCGGTLNCGACASGEVCSSNQCCPSGLVWNKNLNACSKPGVVGCTTPACKCNQAGGTWDGKTCE